MRSKDPELMEKISRYIGELLQEDPPDADGARDRGGGRSLQVRGVQLPAGNERQGPNLL